jgi:hypothetical protein
MSASNEEYLAEQNDCVKRNFQARKHYIHTARFKILAAFAREMAQKSKKILSVGCGSYEPIVIGATHACDLSPLAGQFLQQLGWQGEFKVGDCLDLPYITYQFDVAVCSEVIEHLPTFEDVMKTFEELDTISKNWVITTPCNPRGKLNPEITHKRDFTEAQALDLARLYNAKLFKDELYYYFVKEERDVFAGISDQHIRKIT